MGLGTLDVAGEFVSFPDLSTVTWKGADLNARMSEDKEPCWITGSALISPGLFLLADSSNNCVKLLDVITCTFTSRLHLPGEPWDVCVLAADQAAVTLRYNSMIQLLSTQGRQLSCGKGIKVSPGCYGIASYQKKLYVSYVSNPRIEVMTFDGHKTHIISTFQKNGKNQLYQAPYYLTVSASTPPTLYLSDYNANSVRQLYLDGKYLRVHRRKQLQSVLSVVEVGHGMLLVCGRKSNNVMLLTEEDRKMTEILGEKDGLTSPYSVSFCPHTRSIVVGMFNNDALKVFNAN